MAAAHTQVADMQAARTDTLVAQLADSPVALRGYAASVAVLWRISAAARAADSAVVAAMVEAEAASMVAAVVVASTVVEAAATAVEVAATAVVDTVNPGLRSGSLKFR